MFSNTNRHLSLSKYVAIHATLGPPGLLKYCIRLLSATFRLQDQDGSSSLSPSCDVRLIRVVANMPSLNCIGRRSRMINRALKILQYRCKWLTDGNLAYPPNNPFSEHNSNQAIGLAGRDAHEDLGNDVIRCYDGNGRRFLSFAGIQVLKSYACGLERVPTISFEL